MKQILLSKINVWLGLQEGCLRFITENQGGVISACMDIGPILLLRLVWGQIGFYNFLGVFQVFKVPNHYHLNIVKHIKRK